MDENLHNIEDLFRSALDDNEDTPSGDVWEAIDKRLDKEKIVSIKRRYTNLKRIAIMLLFLLATYVLYDVYKINGTHHSNRLVKNDDSVNANSSRTVDGASDKTLNEKARIDLSKTPVPGNTLTKDKQNTVPNKPFEKNITQSDNKAPLTTNKTTEKKQDITEVINSEKDISENQTAIILNQKKKHTPKSSYKVKIKNATEVEDENILVKNDDEQQYNEILTLRKLRSILIEPVPLLPHDSIDTKELIELIAASKVKLIDTANNSVAKNKKKKDKKPSRFSITPFFSPDIAWYRLQDDKVGNQQDNASELEKEEKHEFSSTYGALVDYKLSKHWGLQSGITLSNTNITVEPKTIYAQQDNTGGVKYRINTSSGYGYVLPSFSSNPAVGDSLYAFTSTHSLQYIGIPLAVTYNVTKGKFKFNALAGLSANILTKAKLETILEKGFNNSMEKVDNLQGLRKMYFSGLAGVGVNYKLTNNTALMFAPTIRFALNSINKDATVKSYPMSFGFVTGLKIDL